jgi:hypothetical protein
VPDIYFHEPNFARSRGNNYTPDRRKSHFSHFKYLNDAVTRRQILVRLRNSSRRHGTGLQSHLHLVITVSLTVGHVQYNKSQKLPSTVTRTTLSLRLPVFHRPYICHWSLQKRWRLCQNKLQPNGLGIYFIVNSKCLFPFVLYGLLQQLALTMETSTEVWGSMTVNTSSRGLVDRWDSSGGMWCLHFKVSQKRRQQIPPKRRYLLSSTTPQRLFS